MKTDENKNPKIDRSLLTPEQRDQLETWQQSADQLKAIQDVAAMAQEIVHLMGGEVDPSKTSLKDIGAVLLDIREKLGTEQPDFAKPVVKALDKLEKAFSSAISGIDVKPSVKVDAPQVHVGPTPVDLKGIEQAMKGIPKAFKEAINLIPVPEKPDNGPLLDAWEGISEQLVSIENATRMKPLPGSIKINNTSDNPIPIIGTIEATIDPTGLATDTNQTSGSQKTQIVDAGGDAVTVTGGKLDVNATASLAGTTLPIASAATAVGVAIVDSSGNQISSFGGGTQYTEGDVDSSITGTAMMVEDTSNTLQPAQGDKANGLDVDVTRSALPIGAATSAKQDTGNTSVASIDTKTPALGQALSAASVPVVLTASQLSTLTPVTGLTDTQLRASAVPVTANAGTNLNTSALALDATLTGGTQKAIARGGAKGTTTAADITSTASGSNHQAIDVAILDGSGNQVTTFGGGTQYADGAARGTATGTLLMIDDGTNVQSAIGTTAGILKVDLSATTANSTAVKVDGSAVIQPVSGTVAVTATDVTPASQNITVIDSASSTATGANNQLIIIGNPTAGSAASFALSGTETIRVEVTGIWTGTVQAEQSIDGGTTWAVIGIHQGAYTTSAFTAGFVGGSNMAGATNFRMRATAAITGTAVVTIVKSTNTQSVYIANAAPSGTVASVSNSSTATLTSGSVFTGVGEDVLNFSETRVSVISNVASATDGLSIQQSSNNSNWDIIDTYTISANEAKTIVVPRQARYFRVVYTNGGTNQASFRLSSILNRTATAPSSQRPSDTYSNEVDLVQGQSFLMGYNGTTWDRVRTTGTGVLSASAVLTAGSAVIGKVSIDQTTPGTTNLVALAANQSVNTAQVNGATVNVGVGSAGTGTQRVTTSTDSTIGTVTTVSTVSAVTAVGTITPGTAASSLGKAEDSGHSSSDTGVFVLGVRNDNAATDVTNANADYSQIATDIKGVTFNRPAPSTSAALTTVASSATNVTLLAANAARRLVTCYNSSTSDAYVKFGTTASSTSFSLYLPSLGSFSLNGEDYSGKIDIIWLSANGNAYVTETSL